MNIPSFQACLECACLVCRASEEDVRRENGHKPGTFIARRLFYVLGHQYAEGSARTLGEFLGRSSKSGFTHATKSFYAAVAAHDKAAIAALAAAKQWMAARGFQERAGCRPQWELTDDMPVPRVYPSVSMPTSPPPIPIGARYLRWASRPCDHTLPADLRAEIDAKYAERVSRESTPKLALLPTEAA